MSARGRIATTVVSQGIYSLGSLLAIFSVSRNFSAAEFGHFILWYSASTLCLAIARQYFSVDLARTSGEDLERHVQRFREHLTAALVLSPLFVAAVMLSGLGVDRAGDSQALVLNWMVAIGAPLAIVHDISRYFLASRGVSLGLVPDLLRFVGLLAAFIVGVTAGPVTFVALWLGSNASSAIVGVALCDRRPLTFQWTNSLRIHWGIRESVTIVGLLSALVPLVTSWVVGLAYSAESLGAWRGATTLFGPLNTLIMFMDFAVLSIYARRPFNSRRRLLFRIAAGNALIAAGWMLVLYLLPESLGLLLLGESWLGAQQFMAVVGVEYIFLCLTAALLLEYKVSALSRDLLSIKLVSSALILVGVVTVSVLQAEVVYVAVASLIGAFVGFGLTYYFLLQRRHDSGD